LHRKRGGVDDIPFKVTVDFSSNTMTAEDINLTGGNAFGGSAYIYDTGSGTFGGWVGGRTGVLRSEVSPFFCRATAYEFLPSGDNTKSVGFIHTIENSGSCRESLETEVVHANTFSG